MAGLPSVSNTAGVDIRPRGGQVEDRRRQHLAADVLAEAAIAFPLRLIEELIRSALVREVRMIAVILEHVDRLVAA